MATKVASLFAEISLQDNMTKKLSGISGQIDSFGNRTRQVGRAATLAIGGAAVAGAAAISKMVVDGLAEFNRFERGMNEVFTLLPGITESAMSDMEWQAKNLSTRLGILPNEVVPALYQAISAGVPQENVFDFLEIASQASIGGVTDLETAVDGISSVVNSYGSDVIDAAKASDLMFTAVKLGKTDFEQLSSSLFNVLPTASGLGVEFENVTAALATLTAQGTPTSVATTQLRQMLVELGDPATEVSEIFEKMAGSSFKDFVAEGNNVQDALTLLEKYADDAGVDVQNLFGSVEAGNAALGLTGASAERFSAALDEMANASGATRDAFDRMEQSGARGFDKLRAVFSVILINIGERLAPAINAVVDVLITMFRIFEAGLDGEWLSDWLGDLPTGLRGAGKALGKFSALLNAFFKTLVAVGKGANVFDALRESLKWGPINERVVDTIEDLYNAIRDATRPIRDFISGIVTGKDVLIAFGIAVASFVLPAVVGILGGLLAFAAPIAAIIAGVAALRVAWENNFLGIQDAVKGVVSWIGGLKDAFDTGGLQGVADKIFGDLRNVASRALEAVRNVNWSEVASTILSRLGDAISFGADWVNNNIITPIKDALLPALQDSNTWETLSAGAQGILDGIANGFLDLTQWVLGNVLSPIVMSIGQELTNADNWNAIGDVASALLNTIATGLLDLTQWVLGNVLSPIVASVGQELTNQDNWNALGDAAGTLLSALAGGLSDIAMWAINDVIIPIGGAIYDAAITPANWAALSGLIIKGLDVMADLAVNLRDWFVENVLSKLVSGAADAANTESNWNPLNGLAKMALTALVNFALPLADWVRQNLIAPLVANIQTVATNPETWALLGGLLIYALRSMKDFIFDMGAWVYTNILFPVGQGIREKVTDPATWATLGGLFIEALKTMAEFVVDLGTWLLENVISPVASAIVDLVTNPSTWTGVKDALLGLGADIIKWIGEGLAGLATELNNRLVTPIEEAVNGVFSEGGPLANTGVAGNRDRVSDFFEGRASGGPVTGGSPYVVGERGPELFIPSRSGTIVPNGAGGMQIATLNVYANDVEQLYDQLQMVQRRRAG